MQFCLLTVSKAIRPPLKNYALVVTIIYYAPIIIGDCTDQKKRYKVIMK